MSDQRLWELGVNRIDTLLSRLESAVRAELDDLLIKYMGAKNSLDRIISEATDSEMVCRGCGGRCCSNGKYRINVLDVIALCASDTVLPVDFGQKPLCPYGTVQGCRLEAALRPADCVVFICDALDVSLASAARSDAATLERVIRDCLHRASGLLKETVSTPLLLWSERGNTDN